MKKIVSLLAVALFATTFAVGCKKLEKCEGADKDTCNVASNFKEGVKCKWEGEKCVDEKAEATPEGKPENKPAYDDTADKAACAAAVADQATCEAAISDAGKAANKVCQWTAAVAADAAANPPVVAAPAKCELGDKPAAPPAN